MSQSKRSVPSEVMIAKPALKVKDRQDRRVKYVFSDVVHFTRDDRTREAQRAIIQALNKAFKDAAEGTKCIFLPTGDGICMGIVDPDAEFDLHLQLALRILKLMYEWSEKQENKNRKCEVRIGLNDSDDTIVKDINGKSNLVGAGINHAQRVMSMADGNQIVVSQNTHNILNTSDNYQGSFFGFQGPIKGRSIEVFQYNRAGMPLLYLNTDEPSMASQLDAIDLELDNGLHKIGDRNSWQRSILYEKAAEKWQQKLRHPFVSRTPPKVLFPGFGDLRTAYANTWKAFEAAFLAYYGGFESGPDRQAIEADEMLQKMKWIEFRHRHEILMLERKLRSSYVADPPVPL